MNVMASSERLARNALWSSVLRPAAAKRRSAATTWSKGVGETAAAKRSAVSIGRS